jgi:hypothetical protein
MPVKTIPHPTLGQIKLGCNRPVHPPKLMLRDYLAAKELPGTPIDIDYSKDAMPSLNLVYMNDSLGDCVVAGCSHLDGVLTGNATSGTPVTFTSPQIEAMYTGMSGGVFNPNDPSTDQGCDPETAFQWWQSNGLLPDGSHKIAGWLGIDATNEVEIRAAIWFFENVCPVYELPDAWINPPPAANGFVWDVAGPPDPNNGHFTLGMGCSKQGITLSTWGMLGTLTYAAAAMYCVPSAGGQLYTVISQDGLVKAMNKFPEGLTWSQLLVDFDSIK